VHAHRGDEKRQRRESAEHACLRLTRGRVGGDDGGDRADLGDRLLRVRPRDDGANRWRQSGDGDVRPDDQFLRWIRDHAAVVAADTATRQTQAGVLGGFAALAFLIAAVGVHGVLAYAVSSRQREIGVRVALGASPGDILAMVMKRGTALSLLGVGIGFAVALAVGQWLQSLLAGVSPRDPWVYGAAIGLVGVMTLVGALLPARRAARIDPVRAIR
jgi:predicted lysophospholipase L1 biosynthesis ABC-type transport system permease subunit